MSRKVRFFTMLPDGSLEETNHPAFSSTFFASPSAAELKKHLQKGKSDAVQFEGTYDDNVPVETRIYRRFRIGKQAYFYIRRRTKLGFFELVKYVIKYHLVKRNFQLC